MKGFRAGQTTDRDLRDTEQRIISAANMAEPWMQLKLLGSALDRALGGMLVYADGANWNPNSGPGVYRRNTGNTAWTKVGDRIWITDYGAKCDGTTDDTTAINNAYIAVALMGGGELWVPNGTTIGGLIVAKAGVALCGQSLSAIIKRSASLATSTNTWIMVDSVSDVGFYNLTLDTNNPAGTDGNGPLTITHRSLTAASDNLTIDRVRFQNGTIRAYYGNSCSIASRGVRITNCDFIGKSTLTARVAPNGQTTQAMRFLPTVSGCGNWFIQNNKTKYIGNIVQVRSGSGTQAFDQVDTVVISGNEQTDILDDPNVSTSPYELFCITGLTVTGNIVRSGGRGFNAVFVKGGTYSGNVAYDQSSYFMEMQTCDGILIDGNAAYNCKTFVNDTSSTDGSTSIHITNNVIVGGNDGEVGTATYQAYASILAMISTAVGHRNWVVTGNLFSGLKWSDAGVRIDGADLDGYVCENNVFIHSEETCRPRAINYVKGSNVSIRNNRVIHSANITDTTISTASVFALISINTGGGGSNVDVDDNTVTWSGTDNRTAGNNTGVIGIGANAGAAALAGVRVRRNTIRGAYTNPFLLQINSGDTVFHDNDQTGATGNNSLDKSLIVPGRAVTALTDANATLIAGVNRLQQTLNVALTANRTLTLSSTGASNGAIFHVTRTAASAGAFTLSVGGLKLLATGQWCEVVYDGAAWTLTKFGSL